MLHDISDIPYDIINIFSLHSIAFHYISYLSHCYLTFEIVKYHLQIARCTVTGCQSFSPHRKIAPPREGCCTSPTQGQLRHGSTDRQVSQSSPTAAPPGAGPGSGDVPVLSKGSFNMGQLVSQSPPSGPGLVLHGLAVG